MEAKAKPQIQEAAGPIERAALIDYLHAAKQGNEAGRHRVAAAMTWAAFSCPDAIEPVYDILASGWLGQGGHNYSAMFLAVVTTISCTLQPAGCPILMQLIAEAWRHGREAPAFMDINWETEWNNSIEAVRDSYDIPVYQSVLPANLLESTAA